MSTEKALGIEDNSDCNGLECCSVPQLPQCTGPQFKALQQHHVKAFENAKEGGGLYSLYVELLQLFETYCKEGEGKRQKILELAVLDAAKALLVKSESSLHDGNIKSMKEVIRNLQNQMDVTIKQRKEFFDEILDLKKPAEREDKICQADSRQLKQSPIDECQRSLDASIRKTSRSSGEILQQSSKDVVFARKEAGNGNECSVLKANLEGLIADFKLARQRISELKAKIAGANDLEKENSEGLSEPKRKLAHAKKTILDMQKPMEIAIRTYKKEFECKQQKLQDAPKDLPQAIGLVTELAREFVSKNSAIESLTANPNELNFEKVSAERKNAELSDEQAARHVRIEALTPEARHLSGEVGNLEKELTLQERAGNEPAADNGTDDGPSAFLESRGVEHSKFEIAARDEMLWNAEEEMKTAVKLLQILKSNINSMIGEKSALESEIKRLKRISDDKNDELRVLKKRLYVAKRKAAEMKKDLQTQLLKNHQILKIINCTCERARENE